MFITRPGRAVADGKWFGGPEQAPFDLPRGKSEDVDRMPPVRAAILFPGQGSQFAGMADPWAEHPQGLAVLQEASEAMGRDVVLGCQDEASLASTEFVQPALLACGVAAFHVLSEEGFDEPEGVAGHSLGEFAALVAAGVFALPEALDLVVARGRAMQRAGEERPGTMTALLGAGRDLAENHCDETRGDDVLVLANINSPVQSVASGSVAAIERLEALAKRRKVRAVRLRVAGAFHSPLMEPAVKEISERIDALAFRPPRFPIAENVSGRLESDPERLRELLSRHVVSPVLWESGIHALEAAGASVFFEAGPGDVLTKLMKRIVPTATAVAIGSPEAAADAVGRISSPS
jgi:[acyl-carrier-protein] S-malonyltransferase